MKAEHVYHRLSIRGSLLARRLVCVCGEHHPCVRSRTEQQQRWRDDGLGERIEETRREWLG